MRKNDGLNLVPFIDIMLVLLCIILCISTFVVEKKIPLNLPNSNNSSSIDDKEKLFIDIDENGLIYIDKKELNKDELKNTLALKDKKISVILRADKNTQFNNFIIVLDILKEMEFNNFAVATQK